MFRGAWACDAHTTLMEGLHQHVRIKNGSSPVSIRIMTEELPAAGTLQAVVGAEYLESLLTSARDDAAALDAVFQVNAGGWVSWP